MRQLPHVLGSREVFEAMDSKVSDSGSRWKPVRHEFEGRPSEQSLFTVGDRPQSCALDGVGGAGECCESAVSLALLHGTNTSAPPNDVVDDGVMAGYRSSHGGIARLPKAG